MNGILIQGAIYCPTSPFALLSVGRLFREFPLWHWKLSRSHSNSLALRAVDVSGAVLIDAVTTEELFLWACHLGPSPRAGVQLPRGADSQKARSRAAHALPASVPAAASLANGLAVPPASSDPPNVPVRLPSAASDCWEFA